MTVAEADALWAGLDRKYGWDVTWVDSDAAAERMIARERARLTALQTEILRLVNTENEGYETELLEQLNTWLCATYPEARGIGYRRDTGDYGFIG